MGIQTSIAIMENSKELPQNTKNRTANCSSNPTTKGKEMSMSEDICIPMFIAALFSIAEIQNQPKYPSTNKWIKKMWNICGILFSHKKKELNSAMCGKVDEPEEHYVKWNKPDTKRNTTCSHSLEIEKWSYIIEK